MRASLSFDVFLSGHGGRILHRFFPKAPDRAKKWGAEKSGILLVSIFLCILVTGCSFTPDSPGQPRNICEIFREHPEWYDAARESHERWGVPIPILMAIIHQESSFISDAKPPRTSCLWILPGPRPSSAYGYAQASDETWGEYLESTGRTWADRDDFADAVDFVGWYCNLSTRRSGISKKDPYRLYLAYHEGHGGFNRKTYRKKEWLMQVARKVQRRADTYGRQLDSCEGEFRKTGSSCLWPF
jgi:hypothetical protein